MYRLVTRSDFDGLVCAMLLKQLELIDDVTFVHPKDVQDGSVKITASDITTNLPYRPEAHLVFDHHAFADEGVRRDLAAGADAGILLDLDEGADLRIVANDATVQIDQVTLKDRDVLAELDAFGDGHVGIPSLCDVVSG